MSTKIENFTVMAEGTKECGAIVWWSLSGYVRLDTLTKALIAQDVPEGWAPLPVGPKMALTRAVTELQERQRMVRTLEERGRYAVVDERVAGDDWEAKVRCRVWLENELPKTEPFDREIHDRVSESYHEHLEVLSHDDISIWLTRMTRNVYAVTLRDRGGIYFVPRAHMETWRKVSAALASVSKHACYEVPALGSEDAIAAITAAILREAEQAAKDFEDAVASVNLGERALNNRVEKCRAMAEKVQMFERLLGVSMEAMLTSLTTLEGQLAAAALACAAETEAA